VKLAQCTALAFAKVEFALALHGNHILWLLKADDAQLEVFLISLCLQLRSLRILSSDALRFRLRCGSSVLAPPPALALMPEAESGAACRSSLAPMPEE